MPNLNEGNYVSIGLRKINQLEISIPPNNSVGSGLVANSNAVFASTNQKSVEKVVESAILKAVKFFQKNPLEKELSFPSSFKAAERKYIRNLCRGLKGLEYSRRSVRDNSGNITRSFEVTIRKRLSCDIKPFVLNLDQRTFNLFNQCLSKHNVTSREHDELNCVTSSSCSSSVGGLVGALGGGRGCQMGGAAMGGHNGASMMQKNSPYEASLPSLGVSSLHTKGALSYRAPQVPRPANPPPDVLQLRERLAVYSVKNEILSAIHDYRVVIITGPTGCGKTTQVPQILLEEHCSRNSKCSILVSEPRGQCAIAFAERVSYERGASSGGGGALGASGGSGQSGNGASGGGGNHGNDNANGAGTVGYQVNKPEPQSKVSVDSTLTYCTTDVLLRTLRDPNFLAYITHVIVDEVHDRKILGDLLLLVMRHSMEKHGNLKVILLSTPTDVGIFQRYFSNSKVVHIRNQRLPQNSQSSLQSVQSVYLDEILMRCSFDSCEMRREVARFSVVDEWNHVTNQWIEVRLAAKRKMNTAASFNTTSTTPAPTATVVPSQAAAVDVQCDVTSVRMVPTSNVAALSRTEQCGENNNPLMPTYAMPTSTADPIDFFDGVSSDLRGRVDKLMFDLWMGRDLKNTLCALTSLFFGSSSSSSPEYTTNNNHSQEMVPVNFVHSHSGMSLLQVAASRGQNDLVIKLLMAGANVDYSSSKNAWKALKWAEYYQHGSTMENIQHFINRNGIVEPSYPLMLQQSKVSEDTRNLLESYFRAHGEDRVNFSLIAQLLDHLAEKEASSRENNSQSPTVLVFLPSYIDVVKFREYFADYVSPAGIRVARKCKLFTLHKSLINCDSHSNGFVNGSNSFSCNSRSGITQRGIECASKAAEISNLGNSNSSSSSNDEVKSTLNASSRGGGVGPSLDVILTVSTSQSGVSLPVIKYVIDTGLKREKVYNSDVDSDSICLNWISRKSVELRKSRIESTVAMNAGNSAKQPESGTTPAAPASAKDPLPPTCFHLYMHDRELSLSAEEVPDIQKRSLERLCLHSRMLLGNSKRPGLLQQQNSRMAPNPEDHMGFLNASSHLMGSSNQKLKSCSSSIANFLQNAPTPPPVIALKNALMNLKYMDAMDENEDLTEIGNHLTDLPITPRLGKIAIYSVLLKCLDPILTIVCSLVYGGPFTESSSVTSQSSLSGSEFSARLEFSASVCSDHLALLRAFQAWQKSRASDHSSYCSNQMEEASMRHHSELNNSSVGFENRQSRDISVCPAKMELIGSKRTSLLCGMRAQQFVQPKGGGDIRDMNINSENWAVVKACLVAGLYPNIAFYNYKHQEMVTRTASKVSVAADSVLLKQRIFSDNDLVHQLQLLPSVWFVFDSILKNETVSYLRGSTIITALSLVLFCGPSRRPEVEWFHIQSGRPRHTSSHSSVSQSRSSSSATSFGGPKTPSSTTSGVSSSLFSSPETEPECNSGNSADEESDNEEPLRRFGAPSCGGGSGGLSSGGGSGGGNSFCDQGIASINIDDWISFKMDDQCGSVLKRMRQKWHALLLRKLKNPQKSFSESDEQIIRTIALALNEEEQNLDLACPPGIGQRPRPMNCGFSAVHSSNIGGGGGQSNAMTAGSNLGRGSNSVMCNNSVTTDNPGTQHAAGVMVGSSIDLEGVTNSLDMTSFFSATSNFKSASSNPQNEYNIPSVPAPPPANVAPLPPPVPAGGAHPCMGVSCSASLLENQMGKPTTYVIITVNSLGDVIQPTATAAASSANGSAINASGNNQGVQDPLCSGGGGTTSPVPSSSSTGEYPQMSHPQMSSASSMQHSLLNSTARMICTAKRNVDKLNKLFADGYAVIIFLKLSQVPLSGRKISDILTDMFLLVSFGQETHPHHGLLPVQQLTFGAEVKLDLVKLLRSDGVSINRIPDGDQLDPGAGRGLCEYIVQSAKKRQHFQANLKQQQQPNHSSFSSPQKLQQSNVSSSAPNKKQNSFFSAQMERMSMPKENNSANNQCFFDDNSIVDASTHLAAGFLPPNAGEGEHCSAKVSGILCAPATMAMLQDKHLHSRGSNKSNQKRQQRANNNYQQQQQQQQHLNNNERANQQSSGSNSGLYMHYNQHAKMAAAAAAVSLQDTFHQNMGGAAPCIDSHPEKPQVNPMGVNAFCPLPERELNFDTTLAPSQQKFKNESSMNFEHDLFHSSQRPTSIPGFRTSGDQHAGCSSESPSLSLSGGMTSADFLHDSNTSKQGVGCGNDFITDFTPFDQRPWSTGFPSVHSVQQHQQPQPNLFSPSDPYQFSPFQQPFEKILDVQNTQPEVCGSLSSANEIAAGLESCDEFQGFGKLSTSFDIKVPVNENQQPFCSYSEDRSRMMENSSRMENEDFSADSFHRGLMDGGFVPSQTGIGMFDEMRAASVAKGDLNSLDRPPFSSNWNSLMDDNISALPSFMWSPRQAFSQSCYLYSGQ